MNKVIETINKLETVRKFSDRKISKEDLKLILKSCVKSATASARQTYSIIVVEDKEIMRKIGYSGDKMLVFNVDFNRVIQTAEHLGYQYIHETPMVDFVTGSTDTILAAQTAVITAKSLGIDSFLSNCVHRGDIKELYKLLNLPEKYCFPLIALILGYSEKKNKYKTEKSRLFGAGVIHYNNYKSLYTKELDSIVSSYDNSSKHFLTLIKNWRDQEYNHYLDYFYEKWCKFPKISENITNKVKTNSSYKSVEETLKRSGFLDKN